MARKTQEWIAKSDDAKVPVKVQLRVFDAYHGKCAITGKKLRPGEFDLDHIVALKDGGEHRESNLRPVWRPAHRVKTAAENSARAVLEAKKFKHIAPKQLPKAPIQSRPFQSRLKPDKSTRIAAAHEKHLSAMRQKAGVA